MNDWVLLAFSVLLLALNAFFVGAEFALISARRSAIEPKAQEGSRAARITLGAMEKVSIMMATAQLGITLASLGLGALGEPAVAHLLEGPFGALGIPDNLLHPVSFVVAMSIVVYLHVVAGEMIPKNIALAGPDRAAILLAPPLVLISKLLHPFVVAMNWIANLMLRAMGIEPKDEVTSTFTRDEVSAMVDESHREGLLDPQEQALLQGALAFDTRTVADVVIPLESVRMVEEGDSARRIEQVGAEVGFSRLPVRRGSEIVGYVHLKDVLTSDRSRLDEPVDPELVRVVPTLRPEQPLREALEIMQGTRSHLARVDKGLAGHESPIGIVVLEDVLGMLVGTINAERTDS